MKKFKSIGRRYLFWLAVLGLAACQKAGTEIPAGASGQAGDPHSVSLETVRELASGLVFPVAEAGPEVKGVRTEGRPVERIVPEKDGDGNVVYYAVNYRGGGFILVAADDRIAPVLAFSPESEFIPEKAAMPDGVKEWAEETAETVREVRAANEPQTKAGAAQWNRDAVQRLIARGCSAPAQKAGETVTRAEPGAGTDQEGCPICGQLVFQRVHLPLNTKWHQGDPYNAGIPVVQGGCHPMAGCVALAMAQVMKYDRHPSSYDWDDMEDGVGVLLSISVDCCRLIRDAGAAVGMRYGCTASGAYLEDVPNALKNKFGYSAATYAGLDYLKVLADLDAGWPVILGGHESNGKGHAWVCHGYIPYHNCDYDTYYYYLEMNWGWGGDADGFYRVDKFSTSFNGKTSYGASFNYNHRRGMVYNIRP